MESLARSIVSRKRRIAATVRDCGPEVAGGSRVEVHTELTTNIVAAYVRRNQIGADQLPVLISTVHQALATLGKPAAELDRERTPAVPIRRSVHRDYIVCLECGWRGKMLRGHLATGDGLTVEQCRARWKLTRAHEMTSPGCSESRSGLATRQDLIGRNR